MIADDTVSDERGLETVITIETLTTGGKAVHMRALLDTGSKSNFIREEKARSTRHRIHPYHRQTHYIAGSGHKLDPIGELVVTFGRISDNGVRDPRTFQIRFLVVPDSVPFDVILGKHFCEKAEVFRPGEFFCPLYRSRESNAERKEREKREAEQKKANEEAKKKEREAQAKKRAAAEAAKNSSNP